MKNLTRQQFIDMIDTEFLEQNITEMISVNIPFPFIFKNMLRSDKMREVVHRWYIARTLDNTLFRYAFKHGGPYSNDWEEWYDVEFQILMDFIEKAPKFKGLIK